jgi:hypothetical protein
MMFCMPVCKMILVTKRYPHFGTQCKKIIMFISKLQGAKILHGRNYLIVCEVRWDESRMNGQREGVLVQAGKEGPGLRPC